MNYDKIDLLALMATDHKGGLDRHKFAEMIIQDCITQIAMIGVSNCDDPDVVWTVDKAIQNIKQHFGVEE